MFVLEIDMLPRLVDLRERRRRVVQRDDSTDLGDDLEVLRCSAQPAGVSIDGEWTSKLI